MAKLKGLEKEVRNTESGNTRLEKTLYQAEKDNNKLVGELREKNEEVKRGDQKHKTINNSIADLAISYKNLEQQTAKSKGELEKNTVVLGGESNRGKEVQEKIAGVEGAIRVQESDLDVLISEEERLRKEHFAALEKNKGLNF